MSTSYHCIVSKSKQRRIKSGLQKALDKRRIGSSHFWSNTGNAPRTQLWVATANTGETALSVAAMSQALRDAELCVRKPSSRYGPGGGKTNHTERTELGSGISSKANLLSLLKRDALS